MLILTALLKIIVVFRERTEHHFEFIRFDDEMMQFNTMIYRSIDWIPTNNIKIYIPAVLFRKILHFFGDLLSIFISRVSSIHTYVFCSLMFFCSCGQIISLYYILYVENSNSHSLIIYMRECVVYHIIIFSGSSILFKGLNINIFISNWLVLGFNCYPSCFEFEMLKKKRTKLKISTMFLHVHLIAI